MGKGLTTDACKAGCLMGALVGDALGAPLEFQPEVNAVRLQSALSMHGGGVLGVGPGQITDDGELTLSLAQVLARHAANNSSFPDEQVAVQYSAWYASGPFDTAGTCGLAFLSDKYGAHGMRGRASTASKHTKSNGALMRASPIAVWLPANASPESVVDCAQQDAQLSHPNKTCLDVNAAYCLALHHLVHHPGDGQGAIDKATAWAKRNAMPEVLQWIETDSRDIRYIFVRDDPGHVKWPFVLAFGYLRQGSQNTYEDALTSVLKLGGDADTNACVVGAMLGALLGVQAIPQSWVKAVLDYRYETEKKGHARPEFLTPGLLLPQLLKQWPWLKHAGVVKPGGANSSPAKSVSSSDGSAATIISSSNGGSPAHTAPVARGGDTSPVPRRGRLCGCFG